MSNCLNVALAMLFVIYLLPLLYAWATFEGQSA